MKVHFVTFGCKANQYDTERFRQELEARGARVVDRIEDADAVVVNTCTVTDSADADARKAIRKAHRISPQTRIVVAGCSAALRADEYTAMLEVGGVVAGHEARSVANEVVAGFEGELHEEAIGGELLTRNRRGTRGWLKIQDGCDRRCSFCATRLARGASRSRSADEIVSEARLLSEEHRELVLTGIHIGHYGKDLGPPSTLSHLVARLVAEVPAVRFRLGSIEATEIDDLLVDLIASEAGVAAHLHIPMQAGSNAVLKRMQRWHTREQYRARVVEIAERVPYLGLGADVIVGFPGESDTDFQDTVELVEALPFTYLHVFPFSVRQGTKAAELDGQVPKSVRSERGRVLRELAQEKARRYWASRSGQAAEIVVEEANWGVSEDYLRVQLLGQPEQRVGELLYAPLTIRNGELVANV